MRSSRAAWFLAGYIIALYVFSYVPAVACAASSLVGIAFTIGGLLGLAHIVVAMHMQNVRAQLIIALVAAAILAILMDPFAFARSVHAGVPWNW